MAVREIAVNTSTLANDIRELGTTLSAVRAQMNQMFNQIAELDTMWDGPANAEFNKQFARDRQNTENMCKTVDSLITCMGYARDQYNSCESEVNSVIGSIRI